MMTDQPFDRALADAIDAEVGQWAPDLDPPAPNEYYRRKSFSEWYAGWDAAVEVAARISADLGEAVPDSTTVPMLRSIRGNATNCKALLTISPDWTEETRTEVWNRLRTIEALANDLLAAIEAANHSESRG